MALPFLSEHRVRLRRKRNFGALYSAITILSLHWAVVVYINSSFLKQFVPEHMLGILYTASSAITIFVFLFISRVLRRVGNYKLTLSLALLECAVLIGMALADTVEAAVPLFVIHQAVVPLLLFNLDVYMEEMIGRNEKATGGRRGLYLGVMSVAGAIAPLASGFLISHDNDSFAPAYVAGALLMLPFLYIIVRYFRTFSDPQYDEIKVLSTLRSFWIQRDVRNVFFAHFHLQLFFTWMVIYTPIYLATVAGFSWSEIGIILFAGLMAYVFFEYPIGVIADRYIGEKEMMVVGFGVIALSTASLAFLPHGVIGLWILMMFLTRTGASLVESTTESYFFKHTDGDDANIISFFRITRPLSYVFGALFGSLVLLYFSFGAIFIVLGFLMFSGALFAFQLKDTK